MQKKPFLWTLGILAAITLIIPIITLIIGVFPALFLSNLFNTLFSGNLFSNQTPSSVVYDNGKSIPEDEFEWSVKRKDLNNFTTIYTLKADVQRQVYQGFDRIVRQGPNGQWRSANLDFLTVSTLSQDQGTNSVWQVLASQGITNEIHLRIVAFALIERFLLHIQPDQLQNPDSVSDYVDWNNLIQDEIYVFAPLFPSQLDISKVGGVLPTTENPQGVAVNTGLYELQKLTTGGLGTFRKQFGEQYDWFIFNQLYQESLTVPKFKSESQLYGAFSVFSKQFGAQTKINEIDPYEIFVNPELVLQQLQKTLNTIVADLPLFQVQIRSDYFVRNPQVLQGYQQQDMNTHYGGYDDRNNYKWYINAPWPEFNSGVLDENRDKWQSVDLDYTTKAGFQSKFSSTTELSDSYLRPADYGFFLVKPDGALISADENINGWKMEYTSNDNFDQRRFSYIYKNVSLNWLKNNYAAGEIALQNPYMTFANLAAIQEQLSGTFLETINTKAALNLRAQSDQINSFLEYDYFDNIIESQLPTYRYLDSANRPQALKDWQQTGYSSKRPRNWWDDFVGNGDNGRFDAQMGGQQIFLWGIKGGHNWPQMTINNQKEIITPNDPIANIANGIVLKSDKLFDLPAQSLYVLPPKQTVQMQGGLPYLVRDETWNAQYDLDRDQANSGGFGMTTRAWRYNTGADNWTPEMLTRYNTTTSLYFENFSAPQAMMNVKSRMIENNQSRTQNLIRQNPTIKDNEGIVWKVGNNGDLVPASWQNQVQTRSNSGWMAPATFSRYLNLNLSLNPDWISAGNWDLNKIVNDLWTPLLNDLITNNQAISQSNQFDWKWFTNTQDSSFGLIEATGNQIGRHWNTWKALIVFLSEQFKYISPNGLQVMPEKAASITNTFLDQLKAQASVTTNLKGDLIYQIGANDIANMANGANIRAYNSLWIGQSKTDKFYQDYLNKTTSTNPYNKQENGGRYLTEYYDNSIIQEQTLAILLKGNLASISQWSVGKRDWIRSSYAEELEAFGFSNFLGIGGLNPFGSNSFAIDRFRNPLKEYGDVENPDGFAYVPDQNYYYGLTSNFWANKHTPWDMDDGEWTNNPNFEKFFPSKQKFSQSWTTNNSTAWSDNVKIAQHYNQAAVLKHPNQANAMAAINQIFIGSLKQALGQNKAPVIWRFNQDLTAEQLVPTWNQFWLQNFNGNAIPPLIRIETFSPLQAWLFNLYQNFNQGVIYARGFLLANGSFTYTGQAITKITLQYAMVDPDVPVAGGGQPDEEISHSKRNQLWKMTLNNVDTLKQMWRDVLGLSQTAIEQAGQPTLSDEAGFEVSVQLSVKASQYVGLELSSLLADFKAYMADVEAQGGNTNGVRLTVLSEVQARWLNLWEFYNKIGNQETIRVNEWQSQLQLFNSDIYEQSSALYRPVIYLQNRLWSWFNFLQNSPALVPTMNIQSTNLSNALEYFKQIGADFVKVGQALNEQLVAFDKMVLGTDANGQINTNQVGRLDLYRNIDQYSQMVINLIQNKVVGPPVENNETAIINIQNNLKMIYEYISDGRRQNHFPAFSSTTKALLDLTLSTDFQAKMRSLDANDFTNLSNNIFVLQQLMVQNDFPDLTNDQAQNHTYDLVNLLSQSGFFAAQIEQIKTRYGDFKLRFVIVTPA